MKRSSYILWTLLILSLFLNVKYEQSTNKITNKVKVTFFPSYYLSYEERIEVWFGIPVQQYAAEQSWMNCITKLDIKSDVVFYGDSHTQRSDFRQYFPDVSICNLGYGGDNLNGFIRRIEMVQKVQPKKIFFMGGINDSGRTTLNEYCQKYEKLFATIIDSLPNTQLYIQSLLPLNPCVFNKYSDKYCDNKKVKQINAIQKRLANKYNLTYIDLYSIYAKDDILPLNVSEDGLHLKLENYDKWAETIRPYVYER